jgi:hypothetical protein
MVVNDEFAGDLTSATGWGGFIDWADTLELDGYEEIIRLAEHGLSSNLPRLASELDAALANVPPRRHGTKEVALAILAAVSNSKHEEQGFIIISDGA